MIREMVSDDVPLALAFCRSAGWNQTERDWRRIIDHEPHGCFVAELQGKLVGTVTTTCFGTELAWIGMMLVDEGHRRKGIATGLMKKSLSYLKSKNVDCIKLDATPLGQPVYERLGFRPEWNYHRWEILSDPIDAKLPATKGKMSAEHYELDRHAFGADRSRWLNMLADVSDVVARSEGFGMLRAGHLANYLGPVIATHDALAKSIIRELLKRVGGEKVFWDLPAANVDRSRLAESFGFRPVRNLCRMWTGERNVTGNTNLQFAITEPATG